MTGSSPALVWATWSMALEYASEREDRGSVAGFELLDVASFFRVALDEVQRIYQALVGRELIIGDRIAKWTKRQGCAGVAPARQTGNAARCRRYRRKRADDMSGDMLPHVARHASETRESETEDASLFLKRSDEFDLRSAFSAEPPERPDRPSPLSPAEAGQQVPTRIFDLDAYREGAKAITKLNWLRSLNGFVGRYFEAGGEEQMRWWELVTRADQHVRKWRDGSREIAFLDHWKDLPKADRKALDELHKRRLHCERKTGSRA